MNKKKRYRSKYNSKIKITVVEVSVVQNGQSEKHYKITQHYGECLTMIIDRKLFQKLVKLESLVRI